MGVWGEGSFTSIVAGRTRKGTVSLQLTCIVVAIQLGKNDCSLIVERKVVTRTFVIGEKK